MSSPDSSLAHRLRYWKPSRRLRRGSLGAVGLVALTLVGFGLYAAVETAVNRNVEKGLISMRAANLGAVMLWLDEQVETARSLAHAYSSALDEQDVPSLDTIDSFISTGLVRAAALQNGDGNLLIGTSAELAGRLADLALDGMPADMVQTRFTVLEGRTSFLVRVPLGDPEAGALVVAFPLDPLSRSLQVSQFGDTGEAYLVRSDGLLMTPPRFVAVLRTHELFTAKESQAERLFARDPGGDLTAGFRPHAPPVEWPLTLAARRVTGGETGVNIRGYRDYRGVEVFGGWSWIERYDVGVIAEMDSSEAYATLTTLRATALSMAAVLLLCLLLMGLLWQLIRRSRLRRADARNRYRARVTRLSEALETTRARFDALFERLNIGIGILEPASGRFRCNTAMAETLGRTREALQALPQIVFGLPEKKDLTRARFDELIAGQRDSFTAEKRYVHPDGQSVWALLNASLVRDEAGAPAYAIVMLQPITEMKRANQALKKANRELKNSRSLLDVALTSARLGVWYWDVPEDRVVWDPSTSRLMGEQETRLELTVEEAFSPILGEDRAEIDRHVQRAFASDAEGYNVECRMVRRDGEVIDCLLKTHIERSDDGQPVRLIGSILDVTEIRASERALAEARDQAERANRAKSAFLANMSHEIRTPLNAIMGFAQIGANDKSSPPDAHRRARMILQSSRHLLRLIDDVLDLSKIEAGRINLRADVFDLDGLVNELDRSYQTRTHNAGIGWKIRRDPQMPRWIAGDESRIRQVLINLLDNALKFTRRGWIGLEVHSQRLGDDHRICMQVMDTGPGVSMEDRERIFQRFEQTDAGRQTQGGTGLGLAISRELAQVMGGNLYVSDGPEGGSRFHFTFLARQASPTAAVSRDIRGLVDPAQTGQVLIVDDEASSRAVLQEMLSSVGFGVREAVDGRSALEALHNRPPGAMLLDLRMPDMDGIEVLAALQEMDLRRPPYVVVISASASAKNRERALEAGADAFLAKPVNQDLLLNLLAEGMGVEYLVGASREPETRNEQPSLPLTTEGLSDALREAMHQAIIAADVDAVLEVADAMATAHPQLTQAVRRMAENFDFSALEQLFSNDSARKDSS